MTLRQLRLFLALAETGSVSGAARAMHVTQPTASMQLREMASAAGLPLYEVVARRVHLTEAGVELARTARAIFDEWDIYQQKVDALRGLRRGRLRVAVVSTAKYFVPRLLGTFCQAHGQIDISLEVLNRDGVVARLRDNLDDLYIMSTPPADIRIEDRVFLPNPLVLIAPAAHPCARLRTVELSQLRDERFILREPGSGTRMATDRQFARQRFRPQRRMELGSNEAIKDAVAGNLGVAVISVHALGERHTQQGVVVLPVRGFPIRSHWHIVYPQGKRLSPIAEVFRDHLVEQSQQLSPGLDLGTGSRTARR